jgi:putative cardiolipin synthase
MTENFDEFWDSPLAVPVEELLDDSRRLVTAEDVQSKYEALSAYASNPANFDPSIRNAIDNMPAGFPALLRAMAWHDVEFISDAPGKNTGEAGLGGGGTGEAGLGGGGESTSALIDAVRAARHSVLIQSPYLILPKGGIELLGELHKQGVRIRISTNSLQSTDNLAAFMGYFKQRRQLLNAGVEL